MDLLFSKYASPFLLLDGMIQNGEFSKFIDEFMNIHFESQKYEFYLHKVYDKSFKEFCDDLENDMKNMNVSQEQIETTIQESENILSGFIPD